VAIESVLESNVSMGLKVISNCKSFYRNFTEVFNGGFETHGILQRI